MAEMGERSVTIARRRFVLRRGSIERTMRLVLPEPISSHYVVIGPRRYPPKQVIALVTGLDRADFTTHQARRILRGFGFAVGRMPVHRDRDVPPVEAGGTQVAVTRPANGRRHELAQVLAGLRGQWVAIKDDELLVAASEPGEVVGWLARHDRRADSMFRVPEDEVAASGLAPL